MSPRHLDLLNRVLTPLLDLAFVAVLATGMFLTIEWFFDTAVPYPTRLFS